MAGFTLCSSRALLMADSLRAEHFVVIQKPLSIQFSFHQAFIIRPDYHMQPQCRRLELSNLSSVETHLSVFASTAAPAYPISTWQTTALDIRFLRQCVQNHAKQTVSLTRIASNIKEKSVKPVTIAFSATENLRQNTASALLAVAPFSAHWRYAFG